MAWSFATLDVSDETLLTALAASASALISNFDPQSCANISWAFATLKRSHDGPLFEALALTALARLRLFRPQELAATAWAFSTLLLRHEPLLT